VCRQQLLTGLLAAASDATGGWATGSPIVRTQGSTDVDCPGLTSSGSGSSSSSSSGAQPSQSRNPTPQPAARLSRADIGAIAGCATAALLAVCALLAWFLIRRRRQPRSESSDINPPPAIHAPTPAFYGSASSFSDSTSRMPAHETASPPRGGDRAPKLVLIGSSSSPDSSPKFASPPPYA
jgi:hypothetical protein